MNIIKKITQTILSENKPEPPEEKLFEKAEGIRFPEAEEVLNEEESEQSPIHQWFLEVRQKTETKPDEWLNIKLTELEELLKIYDIRVAKYKGIIKLVNKSQREKTIHIVEKSKRKSARIKELEAEVKQLKEGINIYKNLEARYTKAMSELQAMQSRKPF